MIIIVVVVFVVFAVVVDMVLARQALKVISHTVHCHALLLLVAVVVLLFLFLLLLLVVISLLAISYNSVTALATSRNVHKSGYLHCTMSCVRFREKVLNCMLSIDITCMNASHFPLIYFFISQLQIFDGFNLLYFTSNFICFINTFYSLFSTADAASEFTFISFIFILHIMFIYLYLFLYIFNYVFNFQKNQFLYLLLHLKQ